MAGPNPLSTSGCAPWSRATSLGAEAWDRMWRPVEVGGLDGLRRSNGTNRRLSTDRGKKTQAFLGDARSLMIVVRAEPRRGWI